MTDHTFTYPDALDLSDALDTLRDDMATNACGSEPGGRLFDDAGNVYTWGSGECEADALEALVKSDSYDPTGPVERSSREWWLQSAFAVTCSADDVFALESMTEAFEASKRV